MMQLKLSVVLCTFNGATYLREQLGSLLAQTHLPDEVVVSDDASTDGTPSMLRTFADQCAACGVECRLILRVVNVGFVRNFSESLREASGDVVFLCDQDDVWRSDKLAVMGQRFVDESELTMLCTDAHLIDAAGIRKGTTLFEALELSNAERQSVRAGQAFDVLLRRSMATGATVALRRDAAVAALPVGEGWIHDEWLAILLASTGKLGMVEDQLIDYRQHGGNQVGMRKRTLRDKWHDLVRPRTAQFADEMARLISLESALAGRSSNACELAVERKRRHFEERLRIGRCRRWRRVPAIWRELRAGNYARFGTGSRSVLRDLLRRE